MKFKHDTSLIHTNPNQGQFFENVTPSQFAGYRHDLVGVQCTCVSLHGLAHYHTMCMAWHLLALPAWFGTL